MESYLMQISVSVITNQTEKLGICSVLMQNVAPAAPLMEDSGELVDRNLM